MSISVACEVTGLSRSSWYFAKAPVSPENLVIENFLRGCVAQRQRRGFWKCFKIARRQGHGWNHKLVYRIYKLLGLH